FPSILNNDLAEDYGIKRTCISDILKQSSKWLSVNTTNKAKATRKHDRQPKWPKLDEAMHIWVESALIANMNLNQEALIIKAKTFTTALSITDFKGTGWVNGFQEQFGLSQYNRNGEALSSSPIESLNEHREHFQAICKDEINDPMDVREFVDIDADVAFEMPSDNDIICNIGNKDDHPTEEEILEPAPKITDHDALKALDLIEMYLLQQPDDFIATNNDRNTV
ncbi:18074_t:CDS:2, partial [Cetraspora pellucida]